jgi:hypothetical protein
MLSEKLISDGSILLDVEGDPVKLYRPAIITCQGHPDPYELK